MITRACSSTPLAASLQSLLRSFFIQTWPSPRARQDSQLGELLYVLPVHLPAPGFVLRASRKLAFLFEVSGSVSCFPSFDRRSAPDNVHRGALAVHCELHHSLFVMQRNLFLRLVYLHRLFERLFAKSWASCEEQERIWESRDESRETGTRVGKQARE